MRRSLFIVAITLCCVSTKLIAQSLPTGFAQVTIGGAEPTIPFATALAFTPDGRIFVTQQNGIVRVIKDNVILKDPFYQTTAEMNGERGMDGITVDPDFDTNHYVYVYYTVPGTPSHNRILRLTADGDKAIEGSETVILDLDNLASAPIHNGGTLGFGIDGKLYVSTGDNSDGTWPQDLDSYLGKILRINKDGSAPPDNPFPTGSEQRKRVWAYGFRNPFSMGFHPVTGQIFANEVGQETVEEINDVTTPGLNYGWPATEGPTDNPAYQTPYFSYRHSGSTPSGCAVVGGDFVPPNSNYPLEFVGKYFFLDFCNNWMYWLDPSDATPEATYFGNIGSYNINMQAAPDGNLYFISRRINAVQKLVYSDTGFPIITSNPLKTTSIDGQSVSLSVVAVGQAPLTYQWMKAGVDIPDATGSTFTIPTVGFNDAGMYTVKVTNAIGSVVTEDAELRVTANNAPIVTIKAPSGLGKYFGGGSIDYSAVATDEEDGALPESAYQWFIDFHHDTHKHDQPPVTGSSGSFLVPDRGETSPHVWYRFIVKATDVGGLTGVDSVDVYPLLAKMTFKSIPSGLQITLDGQPVTTPHTVEGVSGIIRDIGASTSVDAGGFQLEFLSWSMGGDAEQSIVTPNVDLDYTVTYSPVLGLGDTENAGVYPTITRGEVFVPWSSSDDLPEIRVIDMLGRTYTPPITRSSNDLIVNMGNLSPTMYILQCNGSGRKVTAKIAVVR